MRKDIQLSVPNLDMEIVDNLKECIETGWISTGGRFISEFEEKVASYVGIKEAVGVQSGTAALHLSLEILGTKIDDEVLVPTLTFIAAVNPIRYIGAEPIFMDCDENFCIDVAKVRRFCKEECSLKEDGLYNNKTNKRIKGIVVVHVFGNLANMEEIMALAKEYKLFVLEDATEALGSFYKTGKYSGKAAGTVGDMGAYSFNANKIITTGGGGMIVSQNQESINKARYLSVQAKNDVLYFQHDEVGYNYRMLNLQAALGVSQIDKLPEFIKRKKEAYSLYITLLANVDGVELLPFTEEEDTNHWFYALYIDDKRCSLNRDGLMDKLIENGIQCRPVWKLIHSQKTYANNQTYEITKALDYEKNVLNIPCSTNISDEEVKRVAEEIKKHI